MRCFFLNSNAFHNKKGRGEAGSCFLNATSPLRIFWFSGSGTGSGICILMHRQPGTHRIHVALQRAGLGLTEAGDRQWGHLPPHSLMVLNFADYLDVLSFFSQDLPDFMDIGCFADERREHHIYILLYPKLQILDVLF